MWGLVMAVIKLDDIDMTEELSQYIKEYDYE